jgi:hypothetical protein
MNNVVVFNEPQLEFASGGMLEHPRDGLTLFGPADSKGIEKPLKLSYGIIGTHNGVTAFREFVKAISRPVLTDDYLNEAFWPHFPGFEETFHATIPAEPAWVEELDTLELKNAATERDDHKRVFGVTSLFLNRIKAVKKSDKTFRFLVAVVPDFVFANCRPISRFQGGHGHRISKREQRLRTQMLDFFENYEPEQYAWPLDFRFQVKSRAMDLGVPIQIIRESTLRLAAAERRFGGRQLTPFSDRAWNLSTALYYKFGGKPWKLGGGGTDVCHVGVSFKDTDAAGSACSFTQTFLNDGDGFVTCGDEGAWRSGKTSEYHLTRESACRLLSATLNNYKSNKSHNGAPLARVFLHCRSKLNEEELAGYQDACPKGVQLTAVRVAPERLGLRLYRAGAQPVLRGTFWQISSKRAFLWCSGFKPRLRAYDGSEIPQPLCIHVQHGDCDAEQIARDIFALTKLNYNGCSIGENQPMTTYFSKVVGEILASNRTITNHKPEFKYYI